ncbi:MAG: hypothetical protein AB7O78_10760 [Thermoleophilia bacterium]
MEGIRVRGGLALISLLAAVTGFCLGTYEALAQFVLADGTADSEPLAYRLMVGLVLPVGALAVLCGLLALAAEEAGPRARAAAWCGVAVGSLVVALALVGGFFMFLDLAGPA